MIRGWTYDDDELVLALEMTVVEDAAAVDILLLIRSATTLPDTYYLTYDEVEIMLVLEVVLCVRIRSQFRGKVKGSHTKWWNLMS